MSTQQTMPIIERRRIEADILRCVHDVLAASHGAEVARDTIRDAVTRSAVDQGASFRAALGHMPDLADFAEALRLWTAEGALELTVHVARADILEFDVTRCRYAEMYRAMGLGELGPLLSCNRDGQFCAGYNPDIVFTRTQTIMEGASHCDFRYRLAPAEPQAPSGA
ncbi:L-2-amino-thiazoline-4-carboxylic acid hydrolase [Gluconacetobacter tumulisoli]|uniref:L-2-amino-thiazoline-4-carboxylic acid hydrolase n=1 Tax=Gluconacetobacter tumulisoli TaxID=1286189 RepID=A0A7W4K687_9PROT|nr:L-2-amino-thiazoline-4-carboxylic acid hydrolase [Gluconacetobacter tumulisoli]MBB2201111.1 L-2-amino-thiazoline-4-carboxylic acid hydrolase [Gluconacetobacter tumulisoli]